MRPTGFSRLLTRLTPFVLSILITGSPGPGSASVAISISNIPTIQALPLVFEPAGSDLPSDIQFVARSGNDAAFLFSSRGVLIVHPALERPIRFDIAGASPSRIVATDRIPGLTHVFHGNHPDGWRTNIPRFASVRYLTEMQGIEVVFHGRRAALEYDVVVAPGMDPASLRFELPGVGSLRIAGDGSLLATVGAVELRQHRPQAWQWIGGERRPVDARFDIHPDRTVGFRVGSYDPAAELTIDPVLTYSTYLGGSKSDDGLAIATDAAGNSYVTGRTNSTNYPTATPRQASNAGGTYDVFVTKLSPAGAVLFSTYLGGGGSDEGQTIAVDPAGNIYVGGVTTSTNFPTMNPYQASNNGGYAGEDGFITKMNGTGDTLLYSTYLGGKPNANGTAGNDEIASLAVDGTGNVYVAGRTSSPTFPSSAGAAQPVCGGCPQQFPVDAFIAKLNATGSALVYATYLGGSSDEEALGIAVDSSGNAYVHGATESLDFPTVNPFQATSRGGFENSEGFVAKLNAAGSAFVYATYLGGSGSDSFLHSGGIAVDSAGSAYVASWTDSTDFPIINAIQATNRGGNFWETDAFVTKFSPNGSSLVFSTYLGGTDDDAANAIEVDSSGNIYVAGWTDSTDFPVLNAVQQTNQGSNDAFITKINSSGSAILHSTYLGGRMGINGIGDAATDLAIDPAGTIHLVGDTAATNFPLVNPFQSTYGGSFGDAFVARIAADAPVCTLECSASAPAAGVAQTVVTFTGGATAANCGTGSVTYDWDFGDGSAHSTQASPAHTYTNLGTYTWKMTARISSLSCSRQGTLTITNAWPRRRPVRR